MRLACDEHEDFVDGCRQCLRRTLDRRPSPLDGSWRDFEPETCTVVAAGNGFRAVKVGSSDAKGENADDDSPG